MKKIIYAFIVTMMLIVIGTWILIAKVGIFAIDKHDEYKDNVGNEIVYKGDTLTIIDCSIINTNYILDDGMIIDFAYAKKLEIIKK